MQQVDTLQLPRELVYSLILNWRGTRYPISIVSSDTVGDLKQLIWSLTAVPPERQKILGLVKGKLPEEEQEVVGLGLKEFKEGGTDKKKEFMMVGTPAGEEHKEMGSAFGGDTNADLDIDYSVPVAMAMREIEQVSAANKMLAATQRNKRKVREAADKLELSIMSPPREGRRLLVLDLDYCILDTHLWKEENFIAEHFRRPYLYEFLEAISPHYDVCIWSQTSWRWLETKLVELQLLGDERKGDFPITCVLDRTPMFSVYSQRDNKPFKHEVKALEIIWTKLPQFGAKNSIHVDDLSRNFALNPKNGLKVSAYKDAMNTAGRDVELLHVARYLLQLTAVDDFTQLDHSKFRKSKLPFPQGMSDPLSLAQSQNPNFAPPPSQSEAQAQPQLPAQPAVPAPKGGSGSGEGQDGGEGGAGAPSGGA